MSITLYYHPLASFCWKALIALYETGAPFEKKLINLGDSADRAQLEAIWPFAKFPVLRDPARKRDVPEASIIIEYLDRHWPGPQPLIPADWDDALEVRQWDRVFDNYIHIPMQQIVVARMRDTKLDLTTERSTIATAYRLLDRHVASRTWVGREAFSMADCAAAPALFYASTIEPFPDELRHLQEYFQRLTQRPSFQRVIEEAKPYFSFYPFAERIPARFR